MSLLPLYFDNTPTLLNQHFGLGMDVNDLINSMAITPRYTKLHYYRPWRSMMRTTPKHDSGSRITINNNKYQVSLDVQQFTPEEISVKVVDRQIIIEGKHEEKQDEHGFISRHFIRKYILPKEYKIEEITSSLSSDGVLSITAPKEKPVEKEDERVVQITQTGKEHKPLKSSD